MATLQSTSAWTKGLYWVKDPEGGRVYLCNVNEGRDYNSGRDYWYANAIYPLGTRFWMELDGGTMACKIEQPEKLP